MISLIHIGVIANFIELSSFLNHSNWERQQNNHQLIQNSKEESDLSDLSLNFHKFRFSFLSHNQCCFL